jgi:WD40 repeat protein
MRRAIQKTACVNSVAFAPKGQTIAFGGCHDGEEQGFIFLWDAPKFLQSSWHHILITSLVSLGHGESVSIKRKKHAHVSTTASSSFIECNNEMFHKEVVLS